MHSRMTHKLNVCPFPVLWFVRKQPFPFLSLLVPTGDAQMVLEENYTQYLVENLGLTRQLL